MNPKHGKIVVIIIMIKKLLPDSKPDFNLHGILLENIT